jgi:hypothetical protein
MNDFILHDQTSVLFGTHTKLRVTRSREMDPESGTM